MKKLLLLLIGVVFFSGCESPSSNNVQIENTTGREIKIYIIDSCEYIGDASGNGAILTHKGNCKFCKARK